MLLNFYVDLIFLLEKKTQTQETLGHFWPFVLILNEQIQKLQFLKETETINVEVLKKSMEHYFLESKFSVTAETESKKNIAVKNLAHDFKPETVICRLFSQFHSNFYVNRKTVIRQILHRKLK